MTNVKGVVWTKSFVTHLISYFLVGMTFYLLLPTLPVYVTDVLGGSKTKVGYIMGIYALSALLMRPWAGYALDHFGRRKVYLLSLFLYVLSMAIYPFAYTFFILLLIRFIHGFGWGAATTGGLTTAADILPEKRRGEGIGFFGLTIALAMALGPTVGLKLVDAIEFNGLFIICLLSSILALILAMLIKFPSTDQLKSKASKKIGWHDVLEKRATPIGLMMMMMATPFAGIMSFIALYSEVLNIENGAALFFLCLAVGMAILRPIAGRIVDRKGPVSIMTIAFLLSVAGFILLSFSQGLVSFLTAAFLIGLGSGIIMPTMQTMLINIVPGERRGVANSTFFTALDLGISLSSILLGYIAEWTSISIMFLITAILSFIPLIHFFAVVMPDYRRKLQEV